METYHEKLKFYDKHFGAIPFKFPDPDWELLWFKNDTATLDLVNILNEERSNTAHLYAKRFEFKNTSLVFNIRPQNTYQRIYFNQYVISTFVKKNNQALNDIKRKIKTLKNPCQFLDAKAQQLEEVLNFAKHKIESSTETSTRIQFLSTFYRGYSDFHQGNDSILSLKRKYIELFLYSQGLIFGSYLHHLKTAVVKIREPLALPRITLTLKIAFLHQLGILDFLEKKFETTDDLLQMLCLLLDEDLSHSKAIIKKLDKLSDSSTLKFLSEKEYQFLKGRLSLLQSQ
ncbi:MAG: hypothetical protein NVS9B7_08710 [Flavisolibacter sp.]